MPKPPKALSSSSPSLLDCGIGVCCRTDASALETSTSIRFPLAFPSWVDGFVLLSGSNNLASLSNQPGATLLFSASSLAAMASSHAFKSLSASSRTFWIYACNALHDAIISSGCAAWPEEDTTYWDFSSPDTPVEDGGNDDGSGLLYVYGSVVAVGRDTNGDTVKGTCARRGCVPGAVS
jgi:hypothetical protein